MTAECLDMTKLIANKEPIEDKVKSEWLKPSLHPAYARLLCAHLRNRGIDMAELFKGNSLDWETLLDSPRFMNFEQFRHLVLNAMKLTECPWLGLEISNLIQVSSHGPMGYGAVAAPTVRDAFLLVQKTISTRISFYAFSLEEENGRAHFILKELIDPKELREFLSVMLLGSFQDLLSKTSGSYSSDICVSFPFEEPHWSTLYKEHFSEITIQFAQANFTTDMPAELLDWHCLTADEFTYRNALRECEQLLDKRDKGGELSEQLKNHLFAMGAPYPSQESIAEIFHMSVRTLIRKLKSEQTSYQSILDEVRKELACWYLQNTALSIESIAEHLGFQDTSNFSRVFRRWLNCTPSTFRDH